MMYGCSICWLLQVINSSLLTQCWPPIKELHWDVCSREGEVQSPPKWTPSVSWLFCSQWQRKFLSKHFSGLSLTIPHRSAEEEVARKPKLFFVSTSATTTTLQTLSICYVSSNVAPVTCTGRKRRSINIDGGLTPKDAAPVDLEPSQREQAASAPALHGSREGRFLLYWITTTSISTSTSFTTTYSVSSALCTAPGANLCG